MLSSLLALAMVSPSVPRPMAQPFPPGAVRLLPSPYQRASEANARYLLDLEPERLLHNFRKNAGLPPKGETYGGWEAQGIAGHTLGHYLSALALEWGATGDARIKARLDATVDALAECQAKRPDGYVSGIPDGDRVWSEIRRGEVRSQGFDLNGGWVPWYTMHKLFAGLIDAYEVEGNKKALGVVTRLADWAIDVTANLDDAKWQAMLACEHGGMNESLAELSAITGEAKYMALAKKFDHHAVLDPLREGKDELAGRHANTQVPKLIGLARIYELTGDAGDRRAAETFWDRVVHHHSYAIGANSDHEHFGAPDHLADRLSANSAETCNTYNMLKLTRHLFAWNPSAERMDFYERALTNHILGAQDPETGMFVYYHSMAPGLAKEFSTPFDSFWCCVGTGMENPTKYGDSAYFHNGGRTLWVNLFLPSELTFEEAGVTIRQETRYPEEGRTTLTVTKGSGPFDLALRVPGWAKETPKLLVNGGRVYATKGRDGYLHLSMPWKAGDRIEYEIPMALRLEPMADKPDRVAVMYGPTALVADLAPREAEMPPASVLVTDGRPVAEWLRPVPGRALTFTTSSGVGKPGDLTFRPFADVRQRRYAAYVDLSTTEAWTREAEARAREEVRQREIAARTVDVLRTGEMQPERDHEMTGEKTQTGALGDRNWRDARDGGWFSFTMKTDPERANELLLTFWSLDGAGREFDVIVDGETIASESLVATQPPRYADKTYALPERLTRDGKVTVRLQGKPGKTAGGLFGARTVRAK